MKQTSRRLVMHIGPHKTATSYLQHNFHLNRDRLLENGWLYPKTGERVRTAHHDVSDLRAKLLTDETAIVQELKRIGESAKKEQLNILLSSEGFRHWRPKHYERLRALLQIPRLHIVYTIRDPLDVFYAQWAQKVKNGAMESLPDMFKKHFADPAHSHLINPVVELSPVLGLPNVTATVLRYDAIIEQKRDIFAVFMEQVLQLPGTVPIESPARNERLPIELTEFIRALAPLTGLERAREKVSLGQAVDRFLPEKMKQEIVTTVREHAAEARRVMEVRREDLGLAAIERQALATLGPYLYPPAQSDRLYSREAAAWVYYDADALRQNPQVHLLLERALRRTAQNSLWMQGANLAYATAIALRRWRKRLLS